MSCTNILRISIVLCVLIATATMAHSGRTDSNGGHTDRKTGKYHYHGTKSAPVQSKWNDKVATIPSTRAIFNGTGNVASELCLFGCPLGSDDGNTTIVGPIYILNSNGNTKFADWVAYQVTASSIGKGGKRNYKPDPLLGEEWILENDDYKNQHSIPEFNFEKGHLAPLGSFNGTHYWQDTNFHSNLVPQKSKLNRGVWKTLEGRIRQLAKDLEQGDDGVYVMAGPLYESTMPQLPNADEDHTVPSGFWKIVAIRNKDGGLLLASFIFSQTPKKGKDICDYKTTVTDIEERTDLNFFPEIGSLVNTVFRLEETNKLMPRLGC